MTDRNTRKINCGKIKIGGDNTITVQTMWKKSLHSFSKKDLQEIQKLEDAGCDILRFSVPDIKSAEILSNIKEQLRMPIVADIHFDYKIALKCIENGIDKVRINPGNIGENWKVKEILEVAKDKNVPIRVGINTGSLPKALSSLKDKSRAMMKAAEDEIEILEKHSFYNSIFSLKSSNLSETIKANKDFSKKFDYPLHIGITEAGPLTAGLVKSSIALNSLLNQGIGDTIRVSLTDTPYSEVIAGIEILKVSNLKKDSVNIISCPRCGRASFDTHSFISEVYEELYKLRKNIKVAVMGCIVNGPGEAKDADIGITGYGKKVVIFKDGKIISKVDENKGREEFLRIINEI